jgi:hypothetical protein
MFTKKKLLDHRRLNGLCLDCRRPRLPNRSRCERHRRINALRQNAYRKRLAKMPWQFT